MANLRHIQFKAPLRTPTIEFDLSVGAWYVRFKNTKVAKTLCDDDKPGVVAAIDLDSKNEVIGIELIGVRDFSIRQLRQISPVDTSGVDFERAKFVHASNRQHELDAV